MKKFDRLPPEERRAEIRAAALELFRTKGFAATTMENIVEQVTLSKGGVYRLYPSTAAILEDLMLEGMHLRNAFYEACARRRLDGGEPLTMEFLVEMIGDSLLLYPEFSAVYVEFLWEKQRSPRLQALYAELCTRTVEETTELIRRCGAQELLLTDPELLRRLTEGMNAAILSLRVLGLQDYFEANRQKLCAAMLQLLNMTE